MIEARLFETKTDGAGRSPAPSAFFLSFSLSSHSSVQERTSLLRRNSSYRNPRPSSSISPT